MNYLKRSILFTLSYFDVFVYPLREYELWNWLFDVRTLELNKDIKERSFKKFSRIDFKKELTELTNEGKIERESDYYFLFGKNAIINNRKKNKKNSLRKIKKAKIVARVLSFVPGVKMIAICSNLGYFNATNDADIDFFIVVSEKRIWCVRFWCAFLMKILNQRPNKRTVKNKICLSYFVSLRNLNLEFTKISENDIHLVYLLSQYLPIYNESEVWQKFILNNKWINRFLPNFNYNYQSRKYIIGQRLSFFKKIIKIFLFFISDKIYKKIQLKIMPKILRENMNNKNNKVIINNSILKLHSNDKRENINKRCCQNYKIINNFYGE